MRQGCCLARPRKKQKGEQRKRGKKGCGADKKKRGKKPNKIFPSPPHPPLAPTTACVGGGFHSKKPSPRLRSIVNPGGHEAAIKRVHQYAFPLRTLKNLKTNNNNHKPTQKKWAGPTSVSVYKEPIPASQHPRIETAPFPPPENLTRPDAPGTAVYEHRDAAER